MAVCYTVVFSPKEADAWVSFENRDDFGINDQVPYPLHEEAGKYYILNSRNEKIFNIWEQARGDFIA